MEILGCTNFSTFCPSQTLAKYCQTTTMDEIQLNAKTSSSTDKDSGVFMLFSLEGIFLRILGKVLCIEDLLWGKRVSEPMH